MCRCSFKRAEWYVTRGLAEVIAEEPYYTIQLNFEPNGYGDHNRPFYLQDMENKCVVCGAEDNLTLHHVVPSCFRKHFPEAMKDRQRFDVLMVCHICHDEYEKIATPRHEEVAAEHCPGFYEMREKLHTQASRVAKLRGYCNSLIHHGPKMPAHGRKALRGRIAKQAGRKLTEKEIERIAQWKPSFQKSNARIWAKVVESIDDLNAFAVGWRQHFVDTMDPKFLPDYWTPEYPTKSAR